MRNIIYILLFISLPLFSQGTEMINNGTFDDATDWTLDTDWTISGGAAHFIPTGGYYPGITQLSADMVTPIYADSSYVLSFNCWPTDYMQGGMTVIIESASGVDYITSTIYQNYKYTLYFTAPSNIGTGGIQFSTVAVNWSLDNVSLKKCDPIGDDPYYVAADGDDTNSGDITHPWKTFQKAFNIADAGDTVYFRGGTYYSEGQATLNPLGYNDEPLIGNNGTYGNYICYFAYPGETPIWDCINHEDYLRPNSSGNIYNGAFQLNHAEYFHFKGITVRNVRQAEWSDTVMYIGNVSAIHPFGCANTIFENFTVHDIGIKAFYISSGLFNAASGGGTAGPYDTDTSYYINVDVYNVADSLSQYYYDGTDGIHEEGWVSDAGNSADAFKFIDYDFDSYYYFIGCRAWNYSDDGWDFNGIGHTTFENCWVMGGLETSVDLAKYEGNGFKSTAEYTQFDTLSNPGDTILNKYTNCVAFNCEHGFYNDLFVGFSLSGLDSVYIDGVWEETPLWLRQYNHAVYYNCLSYYNDQGMSNAVGAGDAFIPTIYRNTLSFGSQQEDAACGGVKDITTYGDPNPYYRYGNNNWYITGEGGSCPNWDYTDTITVTADDFLYGLDSATIRSYLTAPRQADGSLPSIHPFTLDPTSDLIDAGAQIPVSDGSNITLTYSGLAPDIGAFEYGSGADTIDVETITISAAESATTIETLNGTLQMSAAITPDTATFQTVTWSNHSGTGSGSITSGGLVQAIDNGTDTIRATAQDGTGIIDDYILTYSNQNAITIPTIITSSTLGNSSYYITSGGNATATGGASITAKGVCWSTSENPTLSDNYTTDGTGAGSFTTPLTFQYPGVTYYIRAYATNSEGTAYGDTRQARPLFTTKPMKVSPSGSPIFRGGKVVTK